WISDVCSSDLAVSFGLPLLPVPQNWSWRTKLDALAIAGRRWGREHRMGPGVQAPQAAPVISQPRPVVLQEESMVDSPVMVRRLTGGRKNRYGTGKKTASSVLARAGSARRVVDSG